MATYTAGDQINRALRILGVLAEGEIPSAETSSDALMALNQMLDSWSTERLAVFATMDQTFTWAAGAASKTLGPSGNFVGDRPVQLDDSTYYNYNGVSYGVELVNQEQYDSITLKTATSTLPQVLFVNMDYPDVTMYLYPVPQTALEFHFISVSQLDQPALLTTTLTFPPGYLRAFTYNLACEIAPEFGIDPPRQVQQIAVASKRNLKRINDPADLMSIPSAILPNAGGFNYYTGQPY